MTAEFPDDARITLAHGAGGRQTAALIARVFARHFQNPDFTADDAAILPVGNFATGRAAFTTDGFIISPWQFPGGNIGKLSICGTVNDLACMGAVPRYLSCAFQIEEGFPLRDLDAIAAAMAETAAKAGVRIVAGDTKVAGRGQVDGVFITTTGLGELLPGAEPSGSRAEAGDAIIVTGDVGRHGAAILVARRDFAIDAAITSDCAPLAATVRALFAAVPDKSAIHTIRDATRGGVGTVLHEIAAESHVGIELDAPAIPVAPEVRGVCGLLGLEPLYLACEGRLVLFAPQAIAPKLVEALRALPDSRQAAIIGHVTPDFSGRVVLRTEIGTKTLLPEPSGELLPRIC